MFFFFERRARARASAKEGVLKGRSFCIPGGPSRPQVHPPLWVTAGDAPRVLDAEAQWRIFRQSQSAYYLTLIMCQARLVSPSPAIPIP